MSVQPEARSELPGGREPSEALGRWAGVGGGGGGVSSASGPGAALGATIPLGPLPRPLASVEEAERDEWTAALAAVADNDFTIPEVLKGGAGL